MPELPDLDLSLSLTQEFDLKRFNDELDNARANLLANCQSRQDEHLVNNLIDTLRSTIRQNMVLRNQVANLVKGYAPVSAQAKVSSEVA